MKVLDRFHETLRNIKNPILRKIVLNSCYPLIPNSGFVFHEPKPDDAFIPARYREGETYEIIGKDYQRIANELKERGNEIEWTSAGPISVFRDEKGNRTGEMDVSFMFMYPTIIMPMPEVPNA
ncbi:MAG: hypothetical protein WC358_08620 [Ignavibacteria bacterium]|jgi:hypothetical protein